MPDVAAAVHCCCDLTVTLLSSVHRLAELDLWHCQSTGQFNLSHTVRQRELIMFLKLPGLILKRKCHNKNKNKNTQ